MNAMVRCPACSSTLVQREDTGELTCILCSRIVPQRIDGPTPITARPYVDESHWRRSGGTFSGRRSA